jgi:hypothetical protein
MDFNKLERSLQTLEKQFNHIHLKSCLIGFQSHEPELTRETEALQRAMAQWETFSMSKMLPFIVKAKYSRHQLQVIRISTNRITYIVTVNELFGYDISIFKRNSYHFIGTYNLPTLFSTIATFFDDVTKFKHTKALESLLNYFYHYKQFLSKFHNEPTYNLMLDGSLEKIYVTKSNAKKPSFYIKCSGEKLYDIFEVHKKELIVSNLTSDEIFAYLDDKCKPRAEYKPPVN